MPKWKLKLKGKKLPSRPLVIHIRPLNAPDKSSSSEHTTLPRLPSKYARTK